MQIVSVKPIVGRAEVEKILQRGWRETRFGKLRIIFDFYVPYQFFELQIRNGKKATHRLFAIDAVNGNLDLLSFDLPFDKNQECTRIETHRFFPALKSEVEAFESLEEKLRRGIFARGFFKVKNLRIEGRFLEMIYLPYQVGVYERNHQVRLEIIDAVRGQLEGAKLRTIISEWFLQKEPREK